MKNQVIAAIVGTFLVLSAQAQDPNKVELVCDIGNSANKQSVEFININAGAIILTMGFTLEVPSFEMKPIFERNFKSMDRVIVEDEGMNTIAMFNAISRDFQGNYRLGIEFVDDNGNTLDLKNCVEALNGEFELPY